MRVLFFDPNNPAEVKARAAWVEVATHFWGSLEARLASTSPDEPETHASTLKLSEHAIQASVYGAAEQLQVSPDARPMIALRGESLEVQPLVEWVVSLAPASLINAAQSYGPVLSSKAALTRAARASGFDLRGTRFRVGVGRGHLLEIVAYVPKPASEGLPSPPEVPHERLLEAVEGLVEDALGQALFERWIGKISCEQVRKSSGLRVISETDGNAQLVSLSALYPKVLAVERDIHAGLQPRAWSETEGATWTLLELEPEAAAHVDRQSDLAMVTTCYPELVRCFLAGESFNSRRFSAKNERFAYIQAEAKGSARERFATKEFTESAIDALLRQHQLGAVIGTGLGVHYVYLTLALSDVERAVDLLRGQESLENLQRAWLRFMDCEWANEWVGLRGSGEPDFEAKP